MQIQIAIANGEPYAEELADLLGEFWDSRMDWIKSLFEYLKTYGSIKAQSFNASLEGDQEIVLTLQGSGLLKEMIAITNPPQAKEIYDSKGYINDPRPRDFKGTVEDYLQAKKLPYMTYLMTDAGVGSGEGMPEYEPFFVIHESH